LIMTDEETVQLDILSQSNLIIKGQRTIIVLKKTFFL